MTDDDGLDALTAAMVRDDRMLRSLSIARDDHRRAALACERHAGRVADHPALLRNRMLRAVYCDSSCTDAAAQLRRAERALALAIETRTGELHRRARKRAHRINERSRRASG